MNDEDSFYKKSLEYWQKKIKESIYLFDAIDQPTGICNDISFEKNKEDAEEHLVSTCGEVSVSVLESGKILLWCKEKEEDEEENKE